MSDQALVALVTALGDDELVLGHRHSEWTGYAPHIEEDVAFSSIAQDEIGHAAAFYAIAAEVTGDDVNKIAFGREPSDYRNALLCERPNNEWAYTLARHWLYDTADELRLEMLEDSSHDLLAQLATKMRREERYHLIHADMWMKRVAQGPVEGRSKLAHAVGSAFNDSLGLFEEYEHEDEALEEGLITIGSKELRERFIRSATTTLDKLGMPAGDVLDEENAEFVASSSGDLISSGPSHDAADSPGDGLGGRRGSHTSDLQEMWDVMTSTYRTNPGASW
ncbi:MAG: 1,2-phenylacetyl-CoA epoxidase subunit PaaC [Actinomycetota bacterium]